MGGQTSRMQPAPTLNPRSCCRIRVRAIRTPPRPLHLQRRHRHQNPHPRPRRDQHKRARIHMRDPPPDHHPIPHPRHLQHRTPPLPSYGILPVRQHPHYPTTPHQRPSQPQEQSPHEQRQEAGQSQPAPLPQQRRSPHAKRLISDLTMSPLRPYSHPAAVIPPHPAHPGNAAPQAPHDPDHPTPTGRDHTHAAAPPPAPPAEPAAQHPTPTGHPDATPHYTAPAGTPTPAPNPAPDPTHSRSRLPFGRHRTFTPRTRQAFRGIPLVDDQRDRTTRGAITRQHRETQLIVVNDHTDYAIHAATPFSRARRPSGDTPPHHPNRCRVGCSRS
jgi:hypothetical protein